VPLSGARACSLGLTLFVYPHYQRSHFDGGFMREPAGQLKVSANVRPTHCRKGPRSLAR